MGTPVHGGGDEHFVVVTRVSSVEIAVWTPPRNQARFAHATGHEATVPPLGKMWRTPRGC